MWHAQCMYFYVRVVHVVVVIKSERARTKVSTWTAWRHRWIAATTRACLITAVTMATTTPGWSGRRTLPAPSVACTSTIFYSGLLTLDALFLSTNYSSSFGSSSSSCWSCSSCCCCLCSCFLIVLVLIPVLLFSFLPSSSPSFAASACSSSACFACSCSSSSSSSNPSSSSPSATAPPSLPANQPFSTAVVRASYFPALRSAIFRDHQHRWPGRDVLLRCSAVLSLWRHRGRKWDDGGRR